MEETKRCPYCGEEILAVAKKCKHCGEWLEQEGHKKEKKACPICGEIVDIDLKVCPYCKEPIIDMKNDEVMPEQIPHEPLQPKNDVLGVEPYKNYAKHAFGTAVVGTFLTFATDCAEFYATNAGGLIGFFVRFGYSIPSWTGACLEGISSLFLLWGVACSIGYQKRSEGRDDDLTSFFLKALSILFVACDIISSFSQEGIIEVVSSILGVIMVLFMVINGFFLKYEKDSLLSDIGKAFITYFFTTLFVIMRIDKFENDPVFFLLASISINGVWLYAMYVAHKFLLKK